VKNKNNNVANRKVTLPEMVYQLGRTQSVPATKSKILCPFHDDHNPSMILYENRFECFACGAKGDSADFLKRFEQVDSAAVAKFTGSDLGSSADLPASENLPTAPVQPVASFDWQKYVDAADEVFIRCVAEARGVSETVVASLVGLGKIGSYDCQPAFPIEENGNVVGAHVRGDKHWFVVPKGTKMSPLIVGDLDASEEVFLCESQWDLIAIFDMNKWWNGNDVGAGVATRGAGNGRFAECIPQGKRVYAFPQNDPLDVKTGTSPALRWLKDVATSSTNLELFSVATPINFKDANDWLRKCIDDVELRAAIDCAEKVDAFPAFYDKGKKSYWVNNSRGEWLEIVEGALKRFLRQAGFSSKTPRGDVLSPLDAKLVELQSCNDIAFAGKLAGYSKGLIECCGGRILVTESPRLVVAKKGDWSVLKKLIDQMFCHDPKQIEALYGWLRVAIQALLAGNRRPGQIMVMAGKAGSGKSLLQNLFTELFGGRIGKPYRYMTGATPFNGELFEAEHLAVEDEVSMTTLAARRHFGSRVKEFSVNETQSLHAKHRQAITVKPFWRVSVTLNDEPENLLILPPLDESLLDKFILLKAALHPMPMPTESLQQRNVFWNRLISELPAFVDFLLNEFLISDAMRSERYGILHYHHPELLSAIIELSPEVQLLGMIQGWLEANHADQLHGTASEIERTLRSEYSSDLSRLLSWPAACGVYLGRLQSLHPDRFLFHRSADQRTWMILREGLTKPTCIWPPLSQKSKEDQ